MARIRSIKPELRIDQTVAQWPREARYAWVLLFGYLDDAGRGRDDLRLLVADLFPLDPDVTQKKLDAWLTQMTRPTPFSDIPPLCRYEVAGVRYLHATKWTRHQRINRPSGSKLPPCPEHDKPGTASRSGSVNGSGTTHGGAQ